MIKASIDLGTNSMLLLIAQKDANGWQVLKDQAEIVRLGEGMGACEGKPSFKTEALKRVEKTLESFCQELETFKVEDCVALATAAARKAANTEELKKIFTKYKVPLKIISGDQEARLTFLGANYQLGLQDYCVLDIGGGSTEVLWQQNGDLVGKSLDMGAVQITENFFKGQNYSNEEIARATDYIQKELGQIESWSKPLTMVSVAGTPTTLVACEKALDGFDRLQIHGSKLSLEDIKKWLERFNSSPEERLRIKGLEKKRADIIFAGTLILYQCLQHFACKQTVVSCGGVRYGAVLES